MHVATRVLEILPKVKKYLVEKLGKLPKNSTRENVQSACSDLFICAKTHFFISVASVQEVQLLQSRSFNHFFQSTRLKARWFMYNDLGSCLHNVMNRFIIKDILATADTVEKLCDLDVASKQIWCAHKDGDTGVAAKSEMRHTKALDQEHMQFRKEYIQFLLAITAKLIEHSPLKHHCVYFCVS